VLPSVWQRVNEGESSMHPEMSPIFSLTLHTRPLRCVTSLTRRLHLRSGSWVAWSKQVNFQLTPRHKMISELLRGAMNMYIERRIHSLVSLSQQYKWVYTYCSGLKGTEPIQFNECSNCVMCKITEETGFDSWYIQDISLLHPFQTGCGHHPTGIKAADHSCPSTAEVKNEWSYAYTPHTHTHTHNTWNTRAHTHTRTKNTHTHAHTHNTKHTQHNTHSTQHNTQHYIHTHTHARAHIPS